MDIENQISNKTTAKTFEHIRKMFDKYGYDTIFGRSMVSELLGLKSSNVSKILKKMLEEGTIENVQGYGKGKYKFVKK